jgi:hypothetical protein
MYLFDCIPATGGRIVEVAQENARCPDGLEFDEDNELCFCPKDNTTGRDQRQNRILPNALTRNGYANDPDAFGLKTDTQDGEYLKYVSNPLSCEVCPEGTSVDPRDLTKCVCPAG